MAKRLAVLAATLAVIGSVVSMVVPAVADNGGERVTLRLGEKFADDERYNTLIDVGKKGFGVGDYIVVQKEPLYNRALTRRVGTISGRGLIVASTRQSFTLELDLTFSVGGDLITVKGPLTFAEPDSDPVQEIAITGGTGAYKTAHGELHIDVANEEGLLFTFKLVL